VSTADAVEMRRQGARAPLEIRAAAHLELGIRSERLMPKCHRCERVQSSAELRRTTLGFVCKDNGPWSRCASLARTLRKSRKQAAA
jgi:hypothetical protein